MHVIHSIQSWSKDNILVLNIDTMNCVELPDNLLNFTGKKEGVFILEP